MQPAIWTIRCWSHDHLARRSSVSRARHNRHTFASLHLGDGTPIAFVSDWMGHSTIELTVKRYGHLEPKKGRDWINSLPGLMPQNLQQGCNKAESRAVGAVVNFPASGSDFSDLSGAGDGDRTRDVQLGKLAFYR